jgi:nucleoside-diphosphate-sugar epimerase
VPRLLLITGGAGNIATSMRRLLGSDYRLRLLDRLAVEQPTANEEVVQADVTDLEAIAPAFEGVDAVLHLAGEPRVPATWDELIGPNFQGTYAVFEAARRAGVRKVVFASSNHALGFYNLDRQYPIRVEQPVRPDSYYGVSKAFGEVLARYYADAFGMSMMCIRIGWFLERPHVGYALGLFVSPRDLAQLFRLAIESPLPFGIYNGESNNARGDWDISAARRDLGYAPLDNAADLAGDLGDEAPPGDWPYGGVRPPLQR